MNYKQQFKSLTGGVCESPFFFSTFRAIILPVLSNFGSFFLSFFLFFFLTGLATGFGFFFSFFGGGGGGGSGFIKSFGGTASPAHQPLPKRFYSPWFK